MKIYLKLVLPHVLSEKKMGGKCPLVVAVANTFSTFILFRGNVFEQLRNSNKKKHSANSAPRKRRTGPSIEK
jgi:hypothetical protein